MSFTDDFVSGFGSTYGQGLDQGYRGYFANRDYKQRMAALDWERGMKEQQFDIDKRQADLDTQATKQDMAIKDMAIKQTQEQNKILEKIVGLDSQIKKAESADVKNVVQAKAGKTTRKLGGKTQREIKPNVANVESLKLQRGIAESKLRTLRGDTGYVDPLDKEAKMLGNDLLRAQIGSEDALRKQREFRANQPDKRDNRTQTERFLDQYIYLKTKEGPLTAIEKERYDILKRDFEPSITLSQMLDAVDAEKGFFFTQDEWQGKNSEERELWRVEQGMKIFGKRFLDMYKTNQQLVTTDEEAVLEEQFRITNNASD